MSTRIAVANAQPALTPRAFRNWLAGALAGEVSVYHRGFLAADIVAGRQSRSGIAALNSISRAAQQASEAGLVHLVQLRLSSGLFAYLAVRRPHETSSIDELPAASLAAGMNAAPHHLARVDVDGSAAERHVP